MSVEYYCFFNQLPPIKWTMGQPQKEEKKEDKKAASTAQPKAEAPKAEPKEEPKPAMAAADDDDMFGDVEEDEDAAHEMEMARKAAEAAKGKKKKEVVAKSNILFDIKPFEAETDMAELEAAVRGIVMDGLVWGGSKLADVAYGVKKLVMNTVIEDDKVSVDDLQEAMEGLKGGELVQSTEIVAFNKI